MSLSGDYLALIERIVERRTLPAIRDIFLPRLTESPDPSNEFGAVVLADGSVGVMFVQLDETRQTLSRYHALHEQVGSHPADMAQAFSGDDPAAKALALGAINAIGQHLLKQSGCPLDDTTDSLALFDPQPGERIGMVGYFPPLVKRLAARHVPVTVLELKPQLVCQEGALEVTLDPARLEACDRILCTSSVILNDTVDELLAHCGHASEFALIGPTAGFLPDPLFARGVTLVGGSRVVDTDGFLERCRRGMPWGATTRKYCLRPSHYPGIEALLQA